MSDVKQFKIGNLVLLCKDALCRYNLEIVNQKLTKFIEGKTPITSSDIVLATTGMGITSIKGEVAKGFASMQIKMTGTVTTATSGTVKLFTLSERLRPSVTQSCCVLLNKSSVGQIYGFAQVTIYADGSVWLNSGEGGTTYRTSAAPWCTSEGIMLRWLI